jgi:hypothetical protein
LVQTENKNKLVTLLQTENKQSLENLERLKGQKINTVVEIRRQRQSTSKLKEVLKENTTFSWMIWIVIGFSTFLRFSVQIANLVFAHSLGVVWRESKSTKKKTATKKKPVVRKSNRKSTNKNIVQLKSKPQAKELSIEVSESQMF